MLVAGFGRKGHAVGDIPGVRFKARAQELKKSYLWLHMRQSACPGRASRLRFLYFYPGSVVFTILSEPAFLSRLTDCEGGWCGPDCAVPREEGEAAIVSGSSRCERTLFLGFRKYDRSLFLDALAHIMASYVARLLLDGPVALQRPMRPWRCTCGRVRHSVSIACLTP